MSRCAGSAAPQHRPWRRPRSRPDRRGRPAPACATSPRAKPGRLPVPRDLQSAGPKRRRPRRDRPLPSSSASRGAAPSQTYVPLGVDHAAGERGLTCMPAQRLTALHQQQVEQARRRTGSGSPSGGRRPRAAATHGGTFICRADPARSASQPGTAAVTGTGLARRWLPRRDPSVPRHRRGRGPRSAHARGWQARVTHAQAVPDQVVREHRPVRPREQCPTSCSSTDRVIGGAPARSPRRPKWVSL